MTTQMTAEQRIIAAEAKRSRKAARKAEEIRAVEAAQAVEAAKVTTPAPKPVRRPIVQPVRKILFAAESPATPDIIRVRVHEAQIGSERFRKAFRQGAESTKAAGYVGAFDAGQAAVAQIHLDDEVERARYRNGAVTRFLEAAQAALGEGKFVSQAIEAGHEAARANLKPAAPAPREGKTVRDRANGVAGRREGNRLQRLANQPKKGQSGGKKG